MRRFGIPVHAWRCETLPVDWLLAPGSTISALEAARHKAARQTLAVTIFICTQRQIEIKNARERYIVQRVYMAGAWRGGWGNWLELRACADKGGQRAAAHARLPLWTTVARDNAFHQAQIYCWKPQYQNPVYGVSYCVVSFLLNQLIKQPFVKPAV